MQLTRRYRSRVARRSPFRRRRQGSSIHAATHDDDAGSHLDVNDFDRRRAARPIAPKAAPIERVPAVMDLNFLPDMGRMTGRLRPPGKRDCCRTSRCITLASPCSRGSGAIPSGSRGQCRGAAAFSPSTQPDGPFGGSRPCCGCARALISRASGRCASRTGCCRFVSVSRRLLNLKRESPPPILRRTPEFATSPFATGPFATGPDGVVDLR